jgi:hypothetical protein
MTWNVKKAQEELDAAQHRLASGTGTSDRTLARIAAVSHEQAALTRDGFVEALVRADWSNRRIDAALARVEQSPGAVVLSAASAVRLLVHRQYLALERWTSTFAPWKRVALLVGLVMLPVVGNLTALVLLLLMLDVEVRWTSRHDDEDE